MTDSHFSLDYHFLATALSTYYLAGAITVVRDPCHRSRVAYLILLFVINNY